MRICESHSSRRALVGRIRRCAVRCGGNSAVRMAQWRSAHSDGSLRCVRDAGGRCLHRDRLISTQHPGEGWLGTALGTPAAHRTITPIHLRRTRPTDRHRPATNHAPDCASADFTVAPTAASQARGAEVRPIGVSACLCWSCRSGADGGVSSFMWSVRPSSSYACESERMLTRLCVCSALSFLPSFAAFIRV